MIFFISVLINADDLYLGGIAQLVEHLLCKQGVTGSSPVTSTKDGSKCLGNSSSISIWSWDQRVHLEN